MPLDKFAPTRTDSNHIGGQVKELIRLMTEEAMPWRKAADQIGISRRTAQRALAKPHVRQFARAQKARLLEELSMTVPYKLERLTESKNHMAALRATLAIEDLAQQASADPASRAKIVTGGIVIQLSTAPAALPAQPAPVTIEHTARPRPIEQNAADDE
jgi:hypothetical protein